MAKEINLKELFNVIKKRIWIILVLTFITTVSGCAYSNATTVPLYQSSSRIIIGANADYMKTLQVIIKDPTVLEKVVKELHLQVSPEFLAGQITVESIDSSQVVSISVIDTDPKIAADIANTTAKVFKKEIPNIVNFNDVQFLSEAKINPNPINEYQSRLIIIGFVFGIIVGTGLVFFLDSLNDSIKSERIVESVLGLRVLGSVSKMNKKNINKRKNKQVQIELRGETIGSD
jgi:capsular polysaccharide biosynthesis protein